MPTSLPALGDPKTPELAAPLRAYWRVILKRRWLLAGTFAAIFGGALFYTLRERKVYPATAIVQIDREPPSPLGRQVETVSELGISSYFAERQYYETQYKIIQSRRVALGVVRELRLHRDADFMGVAPRERRRGRGASEAAAAERLRNRIGIEPVRDSRLVRITVEDGDPQRAVTIANAVADVYIRQNLEHALSETVSALDWLSEQLDNLRRRLDTAELALYRFKEQHNILSVSLDERQNMLVSQMTKLSEALSDTQARRIALGALRDQLRQIDVTNPRTIPSSPLLESILLPNLKEELARLQTDVEALSARYGSEHPQLREAVAKRDATQNSIRTEVSNIVESTERQFSAVVQTESGLRDALSDLQRQALELSLVEIEYNRLDRGRRNEEKLFGFVLERTKETDLTRLLRVNNIHVLDRATRSRRPSKPVVGLNLGFGAVLGLLVGLVLAFLIDRLDSTLKTQEDVEEIMRVPFLGLIPTIGTATRRTSRRRRRPSDGAAILMPELIAHTDPSSRVAECCRTIRTNLLFSSPERPIRRLLLTSAGPQEGKTTAVVCLGIVMAQAGSRVLIVDTDMRRPRIHRAFGISNERGLTNVLLGDTTIDEAVVQTEVPRLCALPCGPTPPNPAEIVQSKRFSEVVDRLAERFDVILFDSPPVVPVTDAVVLSTTVDAVVLIVKAFQTTREIASRARQSLAAVGAPIVGCVLNDVDVENRTYGYYYYYYYKKYGQYYQREDKKRAAADVRAGGA